MFVLIKAQACEPKEDPKNHHRQNQHYKTANLTNSTKKSKKFEALYPSPSINLLIGTIRERTLQLQPQKSHA
jgi:hypothetical protein